MTTVAVDSSRPPSPEHPHRYDDSLLRESVASLGGRPWTGQHQSGDGADADTAPVSFRFSPHREGHLQEESVDNPLCGPGSDWISLGVFVPLDTPSTGVLSDEWSSLSSDDNNAPARAQLTVSGSYDLGAGGLPPLSLPGESPIHRPRSVYVSPSRERGIPPLSTLRSSTPVPMGDHRSPSPAPASVAAAPPTFNVEPHPPGSITTSRPPSRPPTDKEVKSLPLDVFLPKSLTSQVNKTGTASSSVSPSATQHRNSMFSSATSSDAVASPVRMKSTRLSPSPSRIVENHSMAALLAAPRLHEGHAAGALSDAEVSSMLDRAAALRATEPMIFDASVSRRTVQFAAAESSPVQSGEKAVVPLWRERLNLALGSLGGPALQPFTQDQYYFLLGSSAVNDRPKFQYLQATSATNVNLAESSVAATEEVQKTSVSEPRSSHTAERFDHRRDLPSTSEHYHRRYSPSRELGVGSLQPKSLPSRPRTNPPRVDALRVVDSLQISDSNVPLVAEVLPQSPPHFDESALATSVPQNARRLVLHKEKALLTAPHRPTPPTSQSSTRSERAPRRLRPSAKSSVPMQTVAAPPPFPKPPAVFSRARGVAVSGTSVHRNESEIYHHDSNSTQQSSNPVIPRRSRSATLSAARKHGPTKYSSTKRNWKDPSLAPSYLSQNMHRTSQAINSAGIQRSRSFSTLSMRSVAIPRARTASVAPGMPVISLKDFDITGHTVVLRHVIPDTSRLNRNFLPARDSIDTAEASALHAALTAQAPPHSDFRYESDGSVGPMIPSDDRSSTVSSQGAAPVVNVVSRLPLQKPSSRNVRFRLVHFSGSHENLSSLGAASESYHSQLSEEPTYPVVQLPNLDLSVRRHFDDRPQGIGKSHPRPIGQITDVPALQVDAETSALVDWASSLSYSRWISQHEEEVAQIVGL